MTKKQETSNREIITDELAQIAEIRPYRRPVAVLNALVSASLLDESQRMNELLEAILTQLGGQTPTIKPEKTNLLQKIFRRKK